eukprot:NODE_2230_length_1473_cov_82.120741_g2118_i0.p1 GENE.NODE_2230_length_1473_cov_82.120741_g2118_i0~~NODE_2230_length_1473_cov_82.120741_g2118_i0.p1  ORF type:complete len:399 (-),score=33.05 NODE_2230_length_1473_cov_82.120741_g2118_i0:158-1354(-)
MLASRGGGSSGTSRRPVLRHATSGRGYGAQAAARTPHQQPQQPRPSPQLPDPEPASFSSQSSGPSFTEGGTAPRPAAYPHDYDLSRQRPSSAAQLQPHPLMRTVPKNQPQLERTSSLARTGSSCSSNADRECIVCLDALRDVVFLPCRHSVCCQTCARSLTKCPLCRQDIASFITGHFDTTMVKDHIPQQDRQTPSTYVPSPTGPIVISPAFFLSGPHTFVIKKIGSDFIVEDPQLGYKILMAVGKSLSVGYSFKVFDNNSVMLAQLKSESGGFNFDDRYLLTWPDKTPIATVTRSLNQGNTKAHVWAGRAKSGTELYQITGDRIGDYFSIMDMQTNEQVAVVERVSGIINQTYSLNVTTGGVDAVLMALLGMACNCMKNPRKLAAVVASPMLGLLAL